MTIRVPAGTAYRQIRATLTEERGGLFTLRVMAKPVAAEWHNRQVVAHRQFRMSDPPDTLAAALDLLAERLLSLDGPPPGD